MQGHKAGGAIFYINNDSTYYAPFDAGGDGTYTDHLPGETDPFYNYDDGNSADESTGTTGATGTTMSDAPQINSTGGERGHDFETAAFALSGGDKGEFYGTLTWGWKIDAGGTFSLNNVGVHDNITTGFGASLRKFIARQNQLTTTASTPAPVTIEMPLDACRDLNATEKAQLKTVSDFARANAKARIWVVARYDAQGSFGLEANHAMAKDNLRGVQEALVDGGAGEGTIRTTAREEAMSAKAGVSPIEVTVVNS